MDQEEGQVVDGLVANLGQIPDRPLLGAADLLHEAGVGQQAASLQQVDDVTQQRFDLEQDQGVELVQQVIDGVDAITGGEDGQGVVRVRQGQTQVRGGGLIGGDPGYHLHPNFGIQGSDGARQVAEGGIGGGIAFHQETDIPPCLELFQDAVSRRQPVLGQDLGVVGHGETEGDGRIRHRQPGALGDVQGEAVSARLAHRVGPEALPRQQLPGPAGDEARIAGAQADASEAALGSGPGARDGVVLCLAHRLTLNCHGGRPGWRPGSTPGSRGPGGACRGWAGRGRPGAG